RAHQVGGRRHEVERLWRADHRKIGGAALRRRSEGGPGRKSYGRCARRDDGQASAESRAGMKGTRAADAGAKHDSSFLDENSAPGCATDGAAESGGCVIKLHSRRVYALLEWRQGGRKIAHAP